MLHYSFIAQFITFVAHDEWNVREKGEVRQRRLCKMSPECIECYGRKGQSHLHDAELLCDVEIRFSSLELFFLPRCVVGCSKTQVETSCDRFPYRVFKLLLNTSLLNTHSHTKYDAETQTSHFNLRLISISVLHFEKADNWQTARKPQCVFECLYIS